MVTVPSALEPVGPRPADADLIELWLRDRSPHTQSAYRRDVMKFLDHVGKVLAEVSVADLQSYAEALSHLAEASRARMLSAIRSLLAFGHQLGALPADVGWPLKLPTVPDNLANRILSEADVQQIITKEPNPRNRTLVRLLYGAGLRVSEVCNLEWRDLAADGDAGQITIRGSTTARVVQLTRATWDELLFLRDRAFASSNGSGPVFRSQKGGRLHASTVWRIVRAAAKRAGVDLPVSPYWLRHAHAAHALDRGAPLHVVQATLGHRSVVSTDRYVRSRPAASSGRYLQV
ncbi:MAG TPA: tyrosine-type recombinase/integrase [Chloroflexota bacterium]|nr:tyrosine-type recombinase/integrase [Chloroflexota bacterium]